jgi:hypothetical protein
MTISNRTLLCVVLACAPLYAQARVPDDLDKQPRRVTIDFKFMEVDRVDLGQLGIVAPKSRRPYTGPGIVDTADVVTSPYTFAVPLTLVNFLATHSGTTGLQTGSFEVPTTSLGSAPGAETQAPTIRIQVARDNLRIDLTPPQVLANDDVTLKVTVNLLAAGSTPTQIPPTRSISSDIRLMEGESVLMTEFSGGKDPRETVVVLTPHILSSAANAPVPR